MYKVCNRCVMDTSASNISFDQEGNCNFCNEFLHEKLQHTDTDGGSFDINKLVTSIRSNGKRKKYDCIVGVSGGLDSSWALVQAVKLGLRPLAVHMDNGWNSELAQNNIANLVTKLEVDLYTYVINWNEYRSLMESFFASDVIDIELLYDNAMLAVNYQQAGAYNLKHLLMGYNRATEGVKMPKDWNWFKYDVENIKDIGKKYGNVKLKTFPSFNIKDFIYYTYIKGVKSIPFLDFLKFSKEEALNLLVEEYSYKPYPYKHYESIFTRFYQGYILPKKFHVDKRRVHLSSLILSSQMTRENALLKLEESPYPTVRELEMDRVYFLKKMNWDEAKLEDYIMRPPKSHLEYNSEKYIWDFFKKIAKK